MEKEIMKKRKVLLDDAKKLEQDMIHKYNVKPRYPNPYMAS